MTTLDRISFQEAVEMLRQRGVVVRVLPGGFCVNFRNGSASTEYRTDDPADAVAHGFTMGEAPAPEPPLGPMGKRMTSRGKMYRHNLKLAARRQRRATKTDVPPADGDSVE